MGWTGWGGGSFGECRKTASSFGAKDGLCFGSRSGRRYAAGPCTTQPGPVRGVSQRDTVPDVWVQCLQPLLPRLQIVF